MKKGSDALIASTGGCLLALLFLVVGVCFTVVTGYMLKFVIESISGKPFPLLVSVVIVMLVSAVAGMFKK